MWVGYRFRKTHVDDAARTAADPTPAQAEAGTYKKGHVTIAGLSIAIETPKDGVRRGVGPDGTPWEATMPAHYGYIKRTEGADGDHVDVSLGPNADKADQHEVYVINQIDPATGEFDEHKCQLGFKDLASALAAYDGSFSDGSGPSRREDYASLSWEQFKTWLSEGDTTSRITMQKDEGDLSVSDLEENGGKLQPEEGPAFKRKKPKVEA